MRKLFSGIILLLIVLGGSFFAWRQYLTPQIEFQIESQHASLSSTHLNAVVLNKYLDEIGFFETKEYFGPGERLIVPQRNVKIVKMIFTDEPQGHLATVGPNNEEVASTGYSYFADSETLVIKNFVHSDLLTRSQDPSYTLNYYCLASLYYLRYLDYEEFITSNKFDFYGTVLNTVVEFQKNNEPIAEYEFT